jgi:tetratricopeptide (TPR) repeat protein
MSCQRLFVFGLLCAQAWLSRPLTAQSSFQLPGSGKPMVTPMEDLVQQGRWQEAAALAQATSQANPQDSTAFYWLGTARLQLHDPQGATKAFRSAQKLGMDTAVLHEGLGLAYYNINQFVLFEQQMETAAQEDPKDFRPKYYLGLYHLTIRSDVAAALPLFDEAIQLKPDDWKSLYQKGNCLEKLGKSLEAQPYYARSIASVASNHQPFGWPYQGMARLLLATDPQTALGFAQKAVEAEPHEYSNHLVLAKIYKRLNDPTEAIREARLAVRDNTTDAPSRYLLFRLYREAGDPQAADAELKVFETLNAVYGEN